MPFIPATRKRTLAKPQEDKIQWNITKGHYKKQCREIASARKHPTPALTTVYIASKFVQFLYNTREENVKLDQFALEITSLYRSVAFSSEQFNKIISDQVINAVRLLEYYYKLFARLKVLALSLSSILKHIENLDSALVELISYDEYIAAYIPHLSDEMLDEFFEKDGMQLTDWSSSIKISNARRLHLILDHYAASMTSDQLKNILVRLMSFHKVHPKNGDENLRIRGDDVLHIFDIIGAINNAAKQSLQKDDPYDMCVILTLAQITLEHMHASVGYTYASWFESLFIKKTSAILDKRTSTMFIKILQQIILYELPSVLQIHGRALIDCATIPNSQLYVSNARKRLLELGLDRQLKCYPISLKTPLRLDIISENNAGKGDEIGDIIQQFIHKDNTIPVSLLHAHVFKKQWFMSTFLPALLDWKGENMEGRNNLMVALKKMNKIPDNLYKTFIQQQKQKKTA
ncbi:hypothetical protein [Parasitella parasitica]|uniref:Fanconi anaemia group A protein helical domain-containing protein n=1 Tax=Parasitella parasitica TaxID=35722 RepID=A0A0B7NG52_9FUNG|nr:hypothetical protein [Parasitella parasitica]